MCNEAAKYVWLLFLICYQHCYSGLATRVPAFQCQMSYEYMPSNASAVQQYSLCSLEQRLGMQGESIQRRNMLQTQTDSYHIKGEWSLSSW